MAIRQRAKPAAYSDVTMRMSRSLSLPLAISIAAHAALLFLIFRGGPLQTPVEQAVPTMTVARSLAMMDELAPAQTSQLVFRLNDRVGEVKGTREFQGHFEWTLDSTPIRIREVSQHVGVAIQDATLTPLPPGDEEEKETTYDVAVEMAAFASTIYDDILFVANLVGEATLHSRFRTRNLLITILAAENGGTHTFSTTTREARQLFLGRVSPVEFLLNGVVGGSVVGGTGVDDGTGGVESEGTGETAAESP